MGPYLRTQYSVLETSRSTPSVKTTPHTPVHCRGVTLLVYTSVSTSTETESRTGVLCVSPFSLFLVCPFHYCSILCPQEFHIRVSSEIPVSVLVKEGDFLSSRRPSLRLGAFPNQSLYPYLPSPFTPTSLVHTYPHVHPCVIVFTTNRGRCFV